MITKYSAHCTNILSSLQLQILSIVWEETLADFVPMYWKYWMLEIQNIFEASYYPVVFLDVYKSVVFLDVYNSVVLLDVYKSVLFLDVYNSVVFFRCLLFSGPFRCLYFSGLF